MYVYYETHSSVCTRSGIDIARTTQTTTDTMTTTDHGHHDHDIDDDQPAADWLPALIILLVFINFVISKWNKEEEKTHTHTNTVEMEESKIGWFETTMMPGNKRKEIIYYVL